MKAKGQILHNVNSDDKLPSGVTFTEGDTFRCNLCATYIFSDSLDDHCKKESHTRKLEAYNLEMLKLQDKESIASEKSDTEVDKNENFNEATGTILNKEQISSSAVIQPGRQIYFVQCSICRSEVLAEPTGIIKHNESKDHKRHKRKLCEKRRSIAPQHLDPNCKENRKYQYFVIEEASSLDNNVIKVLRIPKVVNIVQKQVFLWCKACACKLLGMKIVYHLTRKLHKSNVKLTSETAVPNGECSLDDELVNLITASQEFVDVTNQRRYMCRLCNTGGNIKNFVEHCNSENHLKLVNIFNDLAEVNSGSCNNEHRSETNLITKTRVTQEVKNVDKSFIKSLPSHFVIDNCKPRDEISLVRCRVCNDYLLMTQSNITRHCEDSEHKKGENEYLTKSPLVENPFDYDDEYPVVYYFKHRWPENSNIIILEEVCRGSTDCQAKIIFWCTTCDFKTYHILSASSHSRFNHEKRTLKQTITREPHFFDCDVCNAKLTCSELSHLYSHFHKNSKHLKEFIKLTGNVAISLPTSVENTTFTNDKNGDTSSSYKPGDEICFIHCNKCKQPVMKPGKRMIHYCTMPKKSKTTLESLDSTAMKKNFTDIANNSFRYFFEGKMDPEGEVIAVREVLAGLTIVEGTLIVWCKMCDIILTDITDIYGHINGSRHQKNRTILQEVESGDLRAMANGESDVIYQSDQLISLSQESDHRSDNGKHVKAREDDAAEVTYEFRRAVSVEVINEAKTDTNFSIPTSNLQLRTANERTLREVSSDFSPMETLYRDNQLNDEVYFFKCKVCCATVLGGSKNIALHCCTKPHVKVRRQVLKDTQVLLPNVFDYCSVADVRYYFNGAVEDHTGIIKLRKVCSTETSVDDILIFWCNVCNADVSPKHQENEQHRKKLRHTNNMKKEFDKLREMNCSETFYCEICNSTLLYDSVYSKRYHLKNKRHLQLKALQKDSSHARKVVKPENTNKKSNLASKVKLDIQNKMVDGTERSLKPISAHNEDNNSVSFETLTFENSYFPSLKIPKDLNDQIAIWNKDDADSVTKNSTPECSDNVVSDHASLTNNDHLVGSQHKTNLRRNKNSTIGSKSQQSQNDKFDIIECDLCNIKLQRDDASIKEHNNTKKHLENCEKLLGASSVKDSAENIAHEGQCNLMSDFRLKKRESFNSIENAAIDKSESVGLTLPAKSNVYIDCEICNCKIQGEHQFVNEHRNSQKHKDNEKKLSESFQALADINSTSSQSSCLSNLSKQKNSENLVTVLTNMIYQEYDENGKIRFIECRACSLRLYGDRNGSVVQHHANHMNTETHLKNEQIFFSTWRPSPPPSASNTKSVKKQPRNPMIVPWTLPKGRIVNCPICYEVFRDNTLLHVHMAGHFYPRFNKTLLQLQELPPEQVIARGNKITQIPSITLDDSKTTIQTPKSTKRLSLRHLKKIKLDIEYEDDEDIYRVDEQKLEDIKIGTILSFAIDSETLYCLTCQKSNQNSVQSFYEHLCSRKHLDHLQEMIEDHRKFKNYPGQLSDLALASQYMQETSDTSVECYACGISLQNDCNELNGHIQTASHVDKWSIFSENSKIYFGTLCATMERNFYCIRRYWCVVCCRKFCTEIDFRNHMDKKKHINKVRKFGHCETLIFDYCAVCATLWFGFLKTYSYHSDCNMHKFHRQDGFFLVNKLPMSTDDLLRNAEQVIAANLTAQDTHRTEESVKEQILLQDLTKATKKKYPNAQAYPFGSRISGLGGETSDLDVFLDCSARNYPVYAGKNSSREQVQERLKTVVKCLENKTEVWHINREIMDSRIPIIKVVHRPTAIECDISFTNGLTVENTKLIKAYCDRHPDCRKLIIFVKSWLRHCELDGLNGINSYGAAWLVIYFLQVKSILPTVYELIELQDQSRIIDGWETGFGTEFKAVPTDENIRQMLTQFFEFYANFDYRHNVICPLIGVTLTKAVFKEPDKLPSEMQPYKRYLKKSKDPDTFRIDSLMCLQDPFDLAHNITKAIKKFSVYRFKTLCSYSAQILDDS